MKQKTYILGLVTVLTVVTGTVFKISHWPGAGIILTIGIILFVMIFLPSALISHYRADRNRQNLPLYYVTWITCLFVMVSMLFKIMHLPGAGYLIIISLPFPFVIFLPVFLYVTSKNKNFNIYNTVFVLFLLASQAMFSAMLALNVSRDKISDSIVFSSNYNRVEPALETVSEVVTGASVEPGRLQIVNKIDEVTKLVDDCQHLLLKAAGTSGEEWTKDTEVFRNLDSRNLAQKTMFKGEEPVPAAMQLEEGLKELISELEKRPGCTDLAKTAAVLFDLNGTSGGEMSWTRRVFEENYLSWVLIYLDEVRTNLQMIKTEIAAI